MTDMIVNTTRRHTYRPTARHTTTHRSETVRPRGWFGLLGIWANERVILYCACAPVLRPGPRRPQSFHPAVRPRESRNICLQIVAQPLSLVPWPAMFEVRNRYWHSYLFIYSDKSYIESRSKVKNNHHKVVTRDTAAETVSSFLPPTIAAGGVRWRKERWF